MVDRSYDAMLDWIGDSINPDDLFDSVFTSPDSIGKSADQKYEEFREEALTRLQSKFFSDGAKPSQTAGIRKAMDVLLDEDTDLSSTKVSTIQNHRLAREFNKATEARDFEEDIFTDYIDEIQNPRKRKLDIPEILDYDPEYAEKIEEDIETSIQDLPFDWREAARKKVNKKYRPTRENVGLADETMRTKRGVELTISKEDAMKARDTYSLEEDRPLTDINLTTKQLIALGAKRI